MQIEDIIRDKIQLIENETGNRENIREDNTISVGTCLDFGQWVNMRELPLVLYRRGINRVHILHELIHLQMFFVDQYSLIACNNRELHQVIDVYKNIPEDFVAHARAYLRKNKFSQWEFNR